MIYLRYGTPLIYSKGKFMEDKKRTTARNGVLLGLLAFTVLSGCVVTERHDEGYWDREHSRYWHDHAWVACDHEDMHCR
jgi:hypothetical protein